MAMNRLARLLSSCMRDAGFASLAVGGLVALFAPLSAAAECESGMRIATDTVAVCWNSKSGQPEKWDVLAQGNRDNTVWRPLINRTGDGAEVSRHLGLGGPGTDSQPWRPFNDDHAPASGLERLALDGRVRVRLRATPVGQPYRFTYSVELTNRSPTTVGREELSGLHLNVGPGLGEHPVPGLGLATGLYSFVEAVASQGGTIRTVSPAQEKQVDLIDNTGRSDWFGLHSRYFALLLKPTDGGRVERVIASSPDAVSGDEIPANFLPELTVELALDDLEPGESLRTEFLVFSGPKSQAALADAEVQFDQLLFPGLWQWMRGLSFALLALLRWIYLLVPNWGLAIILLAVVVRIVLYPLARRVMASQQEFVRVQKIIGPEIRDIKQHYKGGEQSERILQLYETHGVSPLAGLKPLLIVLIQLPIFIALFHVLGQAYELHDASFLWMETLAGPDRLFGFGVDLPFFGAYFNLLPVLMAVTTLITIKLSPAPAENAAARRRQNIFVGLMALGFFLLFYPFPAGMVLYWSMANVLHIAQTYLARE